MGVCECTLIPTGALAEPLFQHLSCRGVGTADGLGLHLVGSQPGVW